MQQFLFKIFSLKLLVNLKKFFAHSLAMENPSSSSLSLLKPRLWQIYYYSIRRIIERRNGNGQRLHFRWNRLLIGTYAFEVCRLLAVTYCLLTGRLSIYQYDVFLAMFRRNNIADSTIFIAIIGLPLSAAYFNYAIYLKIDRNKNVSKHEKERRQLAAVIYDLAVMNFEQLVARKNVNSHLWSQLFRRIKGWQFFNPLREVEFWRIFAAIWTSTSYSGEAVQHCKKQSGHCCLSSLPDVSMKVRSQALLIQIVCEIFHSWGLWLICEY